MRALQLCVNRGLGSARMGQCTGGGGSLICLSHFCQRALRGAGAERMLSLGKRLARLVGKFATKAHVLLAGVELAIEK